MESGDKSNPMLHKKTYANGQPVYRLEEKRLTYYYKNGQLKATGPFVQDKMEGEWKFYRETGQLWQIGNFRNGKKHGSFVRYDRKDQVEYQEEFENDKVLKKK